MHAYTYVCIYKYIDVHVYIISMHTDAYASIYIHTYIYMHICIDIICIDTFVHTCI